MIIAALLLFLQIARFGTQTDPFIGVTAIDLESGRRINIHGDDRFPMASVFKFPVALVVLQRVDAGKFKLGDPITIQPSQFSRGHSPLRDSAKGKPVTVTVNRLIELMVSESDNTAACAPSVARAFALTGRRVVIAATPRRRMK